MQHVASIIRDLSKNMDPLPTGERPQLQQLPDLKGVVFDVYGTLVISGSGDISLAEAQDREDQAREALEAVGLRVAKDEERIVDHFHAAIKATQEERRAQGVDFPEVELREVWSTVVNELLDRGILVGAYDHTTFERLAAQYEVRVNPVWPMPGLQEVLREIREKDLRMGIVSNAQFFTPLLFEAFLDHDLESLGFRSDYCVYSFDLLEGKPSTRLYEKLAEKLKAEGIEPGEVLYVGNDMRNDIWPAAEVGFKTALFAGDKRSLRKREDDERAGRIKPDLVITDLSQLTEQVL